MLSRFILTALAITAIAASAQPAVTHVDLSILGLPPVIAAPDELITLSVSGSGCRRTDLDSPPVLAGQSIDFTLVISGSCFATPPGFHWTATIGPFAPGTYLVRRFGQRDTGPQQLGATRTVIVAHRPDAPSPLGPGRFDNLFGTGGQLEMPDGQPFGAFNAPIKLLMQRDGRTLVANYADGPLALFRYFERGAVDGSFASDVWLKLQNERFGTQAVTLEEDGSLLLVGSTFGGQLPVFTAYRVSQDGDTIAQLPLNLPTSLFATDVTVVGRYAYVLLGQPETLVIRPCSGPVSLMRLDATGALDSAFGENGATTLAATGCARHVVPTSDGGLLVSGTLATGTAFLLKLKADGTAVTGFGVSGMLTGNFIRVPPVPLPDGSVIVAAGSASLVRLDASGAIDTTFGINGVAANQVPISIQRIVRQDDGKLIVAALMTLAPVAGSDYKLYQPVVFRYDASGFVDQNFGNGGAVALPVTYSQRDDYKPFDALDVLTLPGGRSYVATPGYVGTFTTLNRADYIFRLQGDTPVTAAVEFHYPAFDHYFVSSDSAEIAKLDSGSLPGWQRTGQTFNVYPVATSGAVPVCRFFSIAFAPKSSHFYTPDPAECAAVKGNRDWLFEGTSFYLYPPDANGNCPLGMRPIFRQYNNGQGGAPNHRYTTNIDVRARMLSQVWVAEGGGPNVTFMCALQ